jgi:hypothetical protein
VATKRRVAAFVFSTVVATIVCFAPYAGYGEETTGLALSKNCTIVDAPEVSKILGVSAQAPPPESQTGGTCTFPSQAASQEGIAAYSIVTQADVVARAPYFLFMGFRRCGNVDPHAPNYAQCVAFRKLGRATTVAEYYAARADESDAVPQSGLGDAAVATAAAVYVLRGGEVFECVARRSEFLDVDRAVALAQLLLARVEPIDAPPTPAASNTP